MCSYKNDLVHHALELYKSLGKKQKQLESLEKEITQLNEGKGKEVSKLTEEVSWLKQIASKKKKTHTSDVMNELCSIEKKCQKVENGR